MRPDTVRSNLLGARWTLPGPHREGIGELCIGGWWLQGQGTAGSWLKACPVLPVFLSPPVPPLQSRIGLGVVCCR